MFQLRIDLGQIDDQQVRGRSVERVTVRPRFPAAAAQQRLVVAGCEALYAAVGVGHAIGQELRLEKVAHRGGGRKLLSQCAALAPGSLPLEPGAASQERLPRCAWVVIHPARKIGPVHRFQGLCLGWLGRNRRAYRTGWTGRGGSAGLDRRRRKRRLDGAAGK